jgi:hypothetical protein
LRGKNTSEIGWTTAASAGYALHRQRFLDGSWEGDVLVVKTTHLKAGWMRRNGLPLSDRATMTDRFHRYGDVLTHVMIVEDPVYLTEPLVKTNGFLLSPNGSMTPYPCDAVVEVVRDPGFVPHYLPGQNPFLGEFGEHYHLPREATRGQAQLPRCRNSRNSTMNAAHNLANRARGRGSALSIGIAHLGMAQPAPPHRPRHHNPHAKPRP